MMGRKVFIFLGALAVATLVVVFIIAIITPPLNEPIVTTADLNTEDFNAKFNKPETDINLTVDNCARHDSDLNKDYFDKRMNRTDRGIINSSVDNCARFGGAWAVNQDGSPVTDFIESPNETGEINVFERASCMKLVEVREQ